MEHHFAEVGKMIELAKGTQRHPDDIAQNGDPTKTPEIAFCPALFRPINPKAGALCLPCEKAYTNRERESATTHSLPPHILGFYR